MISSNGEPGDKLLLSIVAWGTIAFFAVGGWFVLPETTHYIFHYEQAGQIQIGDVDLISLKEDASESAKVRGRGILIFGLFGTLLWVTTVCALNRLVSRQKLPRRVPASYVYTYTLILGLFGIGFFLKMVDVIID